MNSTTDNNNRDCRSRVRLFLSTFLLGVVAVTHAQQEDPRRFFEIVEWDATFSWSVGGAGEFDHETCHVIWAVSQSASGALKLELVADTATHPYYRAWSGITNRIDISLDDREYGVCPDPDPQIPPFIYEYTAGRVDYVPENGFTLGINSQEGTYEVSLVPGFSAEFVQQFGDLPPIVSPVHVEWFPGGTISNTLPPTGLVLSGEKRFPMAEARFTYPLDNVFFFAQPTNDVVFRWDIRPSAAQPLEVVVEPLGYADWRPQGGVDEKDPGNALDIKATLKTKNNAPLQTRASKFVFELVAVSREPGVCMNFPKSARPGEGGGEPAADLQFVPELQADPTLWESTGPPLRLATVEGEYVQVEARLSAFDWGGYGLLKVSAELPDGRVIVGHLINEETRTQILLPKREDGSYIAEKWKREKGISGLSDTDDGENDPAGDGHAGDGLTLYEEYRGFYENGAFDSHISGEPKKKDLFIRDLIGDKRGIALFARVSGLTVHHQINADEIGGDRVINFNHSGGARHRVDQHGIVLVHGALAKGIGCAQGGPGLPRDVSPLIIEHSLGEADGGPSLNGVSLVAEKRARTIAHELLHACNVYHHGGGDERPMWTLDWVAGRAVFLENGRPITVLTEGGAEIVAESIRKPWLGVAGGQHSGEEDCLMRYALADCYKSAASPETIRYWVSGEVAGESLCATPDGTGVNAPSHRPQSRYGPADRGACRFQICVNDAMNHPPFGGDCQ